MPEQILDTLSTGILATEEVDSEPFGFRVRWVHWWSGFRDSDLRPGDVIVAIEGHPYLREERKTKAALAIGGYAESQFWTERGATDGSAATLTIVRGRERKDVTGKVVAERYWLDANNQRTLGPGGPITTATDGFSGSWAGWLERSIEDTGTRVLDRGWRVGTVPNNRQMLAEFEAEKERVDVLSKSYPGPFADRTKEDYEAIRANLLGRKYDLTESDLAWRTGAATAATDTGAQGTIARDAFVAALGTELIQTFPAVDAMRGDRASVAGKAVSLPVLSDTDWTTDVMSQWLVAGSPTDGWYLVQADSPTMRKAFEVMWRYKKKVEPDLPETHEIVGRIGPNPRMVVRDGVAITGLEVEPIADLIGGSAFVDLTAAEPQFAGEAALAAAGPLALSADATPEQAIDVYYRALKQGNEEFWLSLLAPWDAQRIDDVPSFSPDGGPAGSNYLSMEWVRSREVLEKSIMDVRIAQVDEVRPIVKAGELPGVPAIEGTTIEVDHIGLFDGEYRAFRSVDVHRVKRLRRREGEPWRFIDGEGV
jgi:hypothetical protein